ncbi:MAG: DNA-directed RNA polymerase [Piccolia ochrophora]|nr:MAG: DNA-directed RNA polymerase [Piccolia ochrophora]
MLARTARGRLSLHRKRPIDPPLASLLLPWLCPAQERYHIRCQTSPTSSLSPRGRLRTLERTRKRRSLDAKTRRLATAAVEQQSSYEDYVPFQSSSPSAASLQGSPRPGRDPTDLTHIKDFDPTSPIVVTDVPSPPTLARLRRGVSGDFAELHLTLEACLKIGRLERAAVIVRRLSDVYKANAPEVRDLHAQYVRGLVAQVLKTRSEAHLKSVQEWFEVEMRAKGVKPNALTYALLLKATLNVLQGSVMERTIQRYIALAKQSGQLWEVLHLPVMTDSELFRVTQACPNEFDMAAEHQPASTSGPVADSVDPEVQLLGVRSVSQRGLGLKTLQNSISMFADSKIPFPDDIKGTPEERARVYATLRQERLERDAISSAIERWRKESENLQKMGLNTALHTKSLGAIMWDWHSSLEAAITEELQSIDDAENAVSKSTLEQDRHVYGPILRSLPVKKLAGITILSTMAMLTTRELRGMKLSTLVIHIGKAIRDEALADAIQQDMDKKTWSKFSVADRQQRVANLIRRKAWSESVSSHKKTEDVEHTASGSSKDSSQQLWTMVAKAKLGAILIAALMKAAKVPVSREHPRSGETVVNVQPAFYHSYQFVQGKRFGVIKANTALLEQLRKEPGHAALAKHLPMVVEPKKWTTFEDGGYLQTRVGAMRIKGDQAQRQYLQAATEKGDMDQVFAGLDVLAKTSWKINRKVFEVMLSAWNSGEGVADIPPADPQLEYPPEPTPSADPMSRPNWIKQLRHVENEKAGLHSQRCFQNFQLEIARAYLHERFYFPHNLDFRGRAYPIPPYLNHMGADNCRGLLMFSEGKTLGASGLSWLKIHVANVFGYDKASFTEREHFSMQHLPEIYDSATNPLSGKRWWLQAEDPWQCLAACLELKAALDAPNPVDFISHLPVHQDGTCNGLQHYAALGGDVWGARQVNLEPGDRPADIYTAVSELVKREIAKDAASDHAVAKALDGKITRKVVKQTVMTNVYGVTFIGARNQVRKQLEDIMPASEQTPSLSLRPLSAYVAHKIFHVLSTMFKGAHDIQYWLGDCAGRISQAITPEQVEILATRSGAHTTLPHMGSGKALPKAKDNKDLTRFISTVIWTTPLKMPVVQPYRNAKSRSVTTNLQRLHISEPQKSDPVDRRKQLQAFPPNFIHSLDATHMLLSALMCDEVGLTFAAVHDSFWTHAGDVDSMNRVLRDAFIRIHSENVIERLAAEFRARYGDCLYRATVPGRGPVAAKIRTWRKDVVKSGQCKASERDVFELLEESRRLRLLHSKDPHEQAEGRSMITPASLYESSPNQEVLLTTVGDGSGAVLEGKVFDRPQESHPNPSSQDDLDVLEEFGGDKEANAEDMLDAGTAEMRDAATTASSTSKARKATSHPLAFWRPLTFPTIPKKGEFDVARLQNSQYFFS